MINSFWQKQTVLITGGTGFIGRHLANHLLLLGCQNIRIADRHAKPSDLSSRITFTRGDLTDEMFVNDLFKGVTICYHMAALYGGAKFIDQNQATIFSKNLASFTAVFDAAAKHKIKRIIFPSSSLVYNETIATPVVEEDLFRYPPTENPYGAMKLVGEYFCKFYWNDWKLAYTIVRMFNVYGIGDTHQDHVIPRFVRFALSGKPFPIMGDGTETRVFTHINDIVSGLAALGEAKKAKNEVFHLTAEEEISMIELAKRIWKLGGRKEPFKASFTPIPKTTPKRRSASAKKIKETIGWQPKVPLTKGLLELILWTKRLDKSKT